MGKFPLGRAPKPEDVHLYQTHWPDPGTPVEGTLEALDRLVDEGSSREIL
jgi:aryl-alcohol dehydrogenase-like predicted oxidoreductase